MKVLNAFDFINPDSENNYIAISNLDAVVLHLPSELQETWENVDLKFMQGLDLNDEIKELEQNQKNILGIQFAEQMRSSRTLNYKKSSKRPIFGVTDEARNTFILDKSSREASFGWGSKMSPHSSRGSSIDKTKGDPRGMLMS